MSCKLFYHITMPNVLQFLRLFSRFGMGGLPQRCQFNAMESNQMEK